MILVAGTCSICSLTFSLSHCLTVSLSHSLTLSLSHFLTLSLSHSLTLSNTFADWTEEAPSGGETCFTEQVPYKKIIYIISIGYLYTNAVEQKVGE